MPSTAFDNHPYPNPSAFMPSRPEWVLGPPSHSNLAKRRRSSVTSTSTSSPSPPPPYSHSHHYHHHHTKIHHNSDSKQPHRPRVSHDHKSPRHRSTSYERSRSRQPRSRHRSSSSAQSSDEVSPAHREIKGFEAGYAEKNGLALTPLYAPKYTDKNNWTMQRRQAQAHANLQQQQQQQKIYYAAQRRRHHHDKAYYSDEGTDSDPWSSDSDSEADDRKTKGSSGKWTGDENWVAAQKKKRNTRLLTTGLAVVSTVACANNLYQNRKGYMERREERAKSVGDGKISGQGGQLHREEAKQLRQKHLARDLIGLAVAGVCVNNARKGWKRVYALNNK